MSSALHRLAVATNQFLEDMILSVLERSKLATAHRRPHMENHPHPMVHQQIRMAHHRLLPTEPQLPKLKFPRVMEYHPALMVLRRRNMVHQPCHRVTACLQREPAPAMAHHRKVLVQAMAHHPKAPAPTMDHQFRVIMAHHPKARATATDHQPRVMVHHPRAPAQVTDHQPRVMAHHLRASALNTEHQRLRRATVLPQRTSDSHRRITI